MLTNALQPLFDKLCGTDDTEGLCWIQYFGGIAKTVMHPSCSPFDPTSKILRYPITCNAKGNLTDCFNNGMYLNLVPDSKHKSIVYFEPIGNQSIKLSDKSSLKHIKQVTQDVRMVIWANIPKLGFKDCSIMERLYLSLTDCIDCVTWKSNSLGVGLIKTDIIRYNGWLETVRKVFNQYNYGDKQRLFLFPYDVGSIDIRVTYLVDPSCYDMDSLCQDPIPCVRYD